MQIQKLPVSRLKPAPYNPRIKLEPGMPAYERLARSLREFDLVQPLVWNKQTGHLVGGHQRLEILKNEGVAEVDVVVVDLPLEREKALNVALNNEAVAGDWDLDKLTDLLSELNALPNVDATLTGFDEEELNKLLMQPDPEFQLAGEDETNEPNNVRVILEIPPEQWDDVRPDIDSLVNQHRLEIHVKLPQA